MRARRAILLLLLLLLLLLFNIKDCQLVMMRIVRCARARRDTARYACARRGHYYHTVEW